MDLVIPTPQNQESAWVKPTPFLRSGRSVSASRPALPARRGRERYSSPRTQPGGDQGGALRGQQDVAGQAAGGLGHGAVGELAVHDVPAGLPGGSERALHHHLVHGLRLAREVLPLRVLEVRRRLGRVRAPATQAVDGRGQVHVPLHGQQEALRRVHRGPGFAEAGCPWVWGGGGWWSGPESGTPSAEPSRGRGRACGVFD